MTINHNGKVSVAPCGHTGETIIGNYVRCLLGCEGAPVMAKRGVMGHVDNCACKPCQYRRVTARILLKSKRGGHTKIIDWDGTSTVVISQTNLDTEIRSFQLLDKDDKVIAKGMAQAYVYPGMLSVEPGRLIEAFLNNEVAKHCIQQSEDTISEGLDNRLRKALGLPPRVVIGP